MPRVTHLPPPARKKLTHRDPNGQQAISIGKRVTGLKQNIQKTERLVGTQKSYGAMERLESAKRGECDRHARGQGCALKET